MEIIIPPFVFIILIFLIVFTIGYFSMRCFEAARKFRRRENGQTDVEEGRCNCSHSRESHLSGTCHVNQGHIFTITGRRTDRNARRANEPPPAFSDCIKDDKDLPKYEEVIENPHLYNIAKEVEV
uniref:CSON004413 protein n=1 Tax=Culicoides sonorensis TaxID=179676 RepID=A0A336LTN7_CULSO